MRHLLIALAMAALSGLAPAQGRELPPMMYLTSLNLDSLLESLKQKPEFARLNGELIGSPLRLVVSHEFEMTAGGSAAGLTSAMLAGGSLGLLPVVTNNDLVITYDIRVHNRSVSKYRFRENFTEAKNIYANQGNTALAKEAAAWVLTTVDPFLEQMNADPKVAELLEEYRFYFGDQPQP
ncbi:hypothetical protein FCL40_02810 [Ferrimonas sediminicola]|uniref:Uncharacterized protein n=1 Tax=Ferrimonas sediminicola TaxID=2569538 RepID=A0A4U1BJW4_9GAMM|nr:hypothetical protein [Ferrimonas sediminicola]TKB51502.1 hypothetical protein FCL40_02810 [Ferrimonas sediminicola]